MGSFKKDRLDKAFKALGLGIVGDAALPLGPYWEDVLMRRERFYHRQDISTTANGLTFFNAAKTRNVSNLPQPGFIGEAGMWAINLCFAIQPGYQVGGTAEVDGEAHQTDVDPSVVIADMQAIYNSGFVKLKIAGQTVVDIHGLYNFPAGGGLTGFGAVASTAAAIHTFVGTNGAPMVSNKFQFTPPHPIYPDDQIELTVEWPFSRTLKDAYVIEAALEGVVVSSR